MKRLKDIKLFCSDMDGTLFLGKELFPWTPPFLKKLEETGRQLVVLTNNSSKGKADWGNKLRGMGIDITDDGVFSSGEATAIALKAEKPGAKVFIAGTLELISEFAEHGFRLSKKDPDFVVLGFDTTMTYEKMRLLCDFVRAGYPYIATHPDPNCPTDEGPIPDIGAMIDFVKRATGRAPDRIIGKPNRTMIEAVSHKTGVPIPNIAVIGDMLTTDMKLADNAGTLGILVLSGEVKEQEIADSPIKPGLVINNTGELIPYL